MSGEDARMASRPKCSVFIATSLDGFIARPDGAIDWSKVVEREGEDYGFQAFFDTVDTLVMGRTTYNVVLGFEAWPYADKRCAVLTHDPPSPRHGEEFHAGDVSALVDHLAAAGAEHVYVDGGDVISQFLAAGLIDEVTVSVIPIVLGEGLRLTRRIGRDVPLSLAEHRAFDSGLVRLTYRVV
jgi:dihydrofolate reductase